MSCCEEVLELKGLVTIDNNFGEGTGILHKKISMVLELKILKFKYSRYDFYLVTPLSLRNASLSASSISTSLCSNVPQKGMIRAPGSFLSTHSLILINLNKRSEEGSSFTIPSTYQRILQKSYDDYRPLILLFDVIFLSEINKVYHRLASNKCVFV